jgi:hypothetical protein
VASQLGGERLAVAVAREAPQQFAVGLAVHGGHANQVADVA